MRCPEVMARRRESPRNGGTGRPVLSGAGAAHAPSVRCLPCTIGARVLTLYIYATRTRRGACCRRCPTCPERSAEHVGFCCGRAAPPGEGRPQRLYFPAVEPAPRDRGCTCATACCRSLRASRCDRAPPRGPARALVQTSYARTVLRACPRGVPCLLPCGNGLL